MKNLKKSIVSKGIDIQSGFKEFLSFIVEDQYPEITTQEAKNRVKNAVDRGCNLKNTKNKKIKQPFDYVA